MLFAALSGTRLLDLRVVHDMFCARSGSRVLYITLIVARNSPFLHIRYGLLTAGEIGGAKKEKGRPAH